MNEKLEFLYKELNNIDYRKDPRQNIMEFMQSNKIVVIQGQSDDVLDIYGYVSEQFVARDGFSFDDYRCEDFQKKEFDVLKELEVEMIWCPDEERSWLVKANDKYPKKEFNILEDGEVYCTGLIVDLDGYNE